MIKTPKAMNGPAKEDLGLPIAADRPTRSQPPDKEGVESRVLATDSDCLTGEPLDERELRILRIMYHGKGCTACSRLSRLKSAKGEA